jgi:hypothetical protein
MTTLTTTSRSPAEELSVRPARADDTFALRRLAQVDSARPLDGDVLLAEAGGRLLAAVEVESGRAVADPFLPSANAVALLRLRAHQLLGPADRRRVLTRRPVLRAAA